MAGIDPSIILRAGQGVPPIQQPDPYDRYAKILGIQSAQGAQQLQAMQLDAARRGVADEDATRAAFTEAAGDQSKTLQALYGRGLYKPAQAIEKARDESLKTKAGIAKDTAAAAKSENEVAIENMKRGASILSLATPENWSGIRMLMISDFPKTASQLPEQFDPDFVKAKIAQGQTITERLKAKHDADQLAETGRHNVTTEREIGRHNAGTERIAAGQLGVSQGQLGVAQGRLAMERDAPRGTYDSERGIIVDPRSGASTPVTAGGAPIGPKDKDAPEALLKAAGYADRMKKAATVLDTFAADGKPGVAEALAGRLPAGAGNVASNAARTTERQQYNQAAEDWVRAKLRQESGAVIADEEMAREIRTYFPQIGDKPEVIAQKKQARTTAEQAMTTMAGRAGRPSVGASGGWSIKQVP